MFFNSHQITGHRNSAAHHTPPPRGSGNPVEHLARVEKNGGFHFMHRKIPPDAETSTHWELRVSPEDYRVILTAFIREIRSVNAIRF
jgi:hypothetical protein